MNTSLYIHIPFCRKKCIYCDFYSTTHEDGLASSYIDALIKQVEKLDIMPYTIYIGGGTPTVLSKNLLAGLSNSLKRLRAGAHEFTVEVNPESVDIDKAKLLLDSGVNRVSIGIQSLRNRKLVALGRIHDARRGIEAVSLAKKAGFDNISIDLIFGVWTEDEKSWEKELKEAIGMPVRHLSCYSLTYEKGTPLWEAVRSGSVRPIDDDIAAGMYESAVEILGLGGFKQYEVSNFAKESFRSKHNLNYWDNNPYIGLGVSAASYINGIRSKNIPDVKEYIRRSGSGISTMESSEKLSPRKSAKETAAIKIRTKDGIDFAWFEEKTGFDFMKLERRAVEKLAEDGLIKYIKENNIPTGICLKRKGFLFADTVSSALV